MQGHDTDRIKFDARVYQVHCLECDNEFEATRNDATFCSPKCRVAYGRRPQKRANALKRIDEISVEINQLASKYYKSDEFFEKFMALRNSLDYALSKFEAAERNGF